MSDSASPSAQAAALAQSAGVRRREDLIAVRVTGDDRLAWLNGQVTNDVRAIGAGAAVYALAVTVRGKIMADLWVLERGSHLCLLLPESAAGTVLESFESQIIMEDVELARDPELRALSIQGPRAAEVARAEAPALEVHAADELGHGGVFVLAAAQAESAVYERLVAQAAAVGGGAVSEAGFELARVRAGKPRFGRDFGAQQYPQEAGLKQAAVSFQKGCYLGQEVVCTLENRGRLTRRLARFEATGTALPDAQAELRDAEGAPGGQLTSVVNDPELGAVRALGYVKCALATPGKQFTAGATAFALIGLVGDA